MIDDGLRISYDLNKAVSGIGIQAEVLMSVKGNFLIKEFLVYYVDRHFVRENGDYDMELIAPAVYAIRLEKYGYRCCDSELELQESMKVYPSSFIAPTIKNRDVVRNFAVHCAAHSWSADNCNTMLRIKRVVSKLLNALSVRLVHG